MAGSFEVPEMRYAKVGSDRIAYQVLGEGPVDLVCLSSLGADCIDARWEFPPYASFLRRLASFSRLIIFDPRGVGASDPIQLDAVPNWEAWADDAEVVLDAVGSEQTVILGWADGGAIATLFAASHPERTRALVLGNTVAKFMRAPDYPWGFTESDVDTTLTVMEEAWGTEMLATMAGSDDDPAFVSWFAKASRRSCSRRAYVAYMRAIQFMDVRAVLPTIRVPTLVIHRQNAVFYPADQGRALADGIPAAQFVVVPGSDMALYTRPNAQILDRIEEFVTGTSPLAVPDRTLAAVLFTDIVGSTERAAALGDRRWRSLIETHDRVMAEIIEQFRGRLIKTTGDGLLATFDGPARAIRCAMVLTDAIRPLGIEIRAGIHTGEIETLADDVAGIAVHTAQRICTLAGPNEVLVSRTVTDLVAGSGIDFSDRGEHRLKGVPATWSVFAVDG